MAKPHQSSYGVFFIMYRVRVYEYPTLGKRKSKKAFLTAFNYLLYNFSRYSSFRSIATLRLQLFIFPRILP